RTAPADACGRCPQKIKIVSLIKGTDDGGGSIGVRPLALVGVGLRQSRRWLKRTAPADACGRCPQKIKIVVSLVEGETTITAPINPSIVSLIKGQKR
ncbi:MAG: hypothetical protein MPJ79_01350, partial [Alphaproteobacteria bacterium]|nr:hypothetical protein [Alphaproteobacteria bacterium]